MITGWRIVKTRYTSSAFDGEGARLYGGRWNSPGTRMVYTAESISLAILEMLVHLDDSNTLSSYSLCSAQFDEPLVTSIKINELPPNWREYPTLPRLQQIGDQWIKSQASVVLRVPSVVVETESNYLINPSHPDFSLVKLGKPKPYEFDSRLRPRSNKRS
jgi:RES domain-containing protein